MLSHVRTGESISYSDLPYTYISTEPADKGEKPGAKGEGEGKGKAAGVPRQGGSEAARRVDALEVGDCDGTGPEEEEEEEGLAR